MVKQIIKKYNTWKSFVTEYGIDGGYTLLADNLMSILNLNKTLKKYRTDSNRTLSDDLYELYENNGLLGDDTIYGNGRYPYLEYIKEQTGKEVDKRIQEYIETLEKQKPTEEDRVFDLFNIGILTRIKNQSIEERNLSLSTQSRYITIQKLFNQMQDSMNPKDVKMVEKIMEIKGEKLYPKIKGIEIISLEDKLNDGEWVREYNLKYGKMHGNEIIHGQIRVDEYSLKQDIVNLIQEG